MVDELAPVSGPRWVELEGGSYWAGSDDFYPDEAPAREAHVDGFALGLTPVTNRQFMQFAEDSGYVTVAERSLTETDFPHLTDLDRAPGSLVFRQTDGPVDLRDWQQWWAWVPGANWRQPRGNGSDVQSLLDHPVVHVAYSDACAYAEWVGGRLPTEAELEYAACGGSRPAPYAWGKDRDPEGQLMANTWRGRFPYRNDGANGWYGTSPVGSFPPNGYGLYDTIGNVWEWTNDLYRARTQDNGCGCGCGTRTTAVPQESDPEILQRVLKGGSHLCAPEYCLRYRPAARSPQTEDSATTHIGFRVVRVD